jgi:hypothetical protein
MSGLNRHEHFSVDLGGFLVNLLAASKCFCVLLDVLMPSQLPTVGVKILKSLVRELENYFIA